MFKIVRTTKKKPIKRKTTRASQGWKFTYPIYGAGCFAIFMLCLTLYLYTGPLVEGAQKWAVAQTQYLGIVLEDVVVLGRSRTPREEVLAIVGLDRNDALYDFDPYEAKRKLEEAPWVETAFVQRRMPHTIFIHLEERIPVALWQYKGKHQLIDSKGQIIEGQDPRNFRDMIHVVGQNAAAHAPQLIRALDSFPSVRAHITSLTHHHGARWDMRMRDQVNVKLPEEGLSQALSKLQELDSEYDFSKGEIMTIDMRFPDKLILRLTPEAIKRRQAMGRDA